MNSSSVTLAIVGIIVGIVYVGIIRRRNQDRQIITEYQVRESLYRKEQADLVARQLEEIEKGLEEKAKIAKDLKNEYDKKYRSSSGNNSSDSDNQ